MLRGRPKPPLESTLITLYGIKNCDTVKKARRWLEQHEIDYSFHDFRQDGLPQDTVETWLDELGWETLVNRRSTSWKQLSPQQRETMDRQSALVAILQQSTLIKRPLLDTGTSRHVGFSAADYREIFHQHTL
jgi:Spx/MgsR family transcriptional regulator